MVLIGCLTLVGCAHAYEKPSLLKSTVVSYADATTTAENWGSFSTYLTQDTVGTRDSLVATATIKPGQEIHPPHAHAEEEYLYIVEGEGTWFLNGKSFPAKAGDFLYAAPWDYHGAKNTGSVPLTFVVWKWNGAGITPPKEPLGNGAGE
ncbi:MAG: cupin [Robiginitomaculum sp.]|nr:MAG: cupin [Robiginitomaculum sp.]